MLALTVFGERHVTVDGNCRLAALLSDRSLRVMVSVVNLMRIKVTTALLMQWKVLMVHLVSKTVDSFGLVVRRIRRQASMRLLTDRLLAHWHLKLDWADRYLRFRRRL